MASRLKLKFLLYFFLFLNSINAFSQGVVGKGRIAGRVIDSLSKKPIEYATISLIKKENKKIVNGSLADEKGAFKIENVDEGIYTLSIFFIGYATKEIKEIDINKNHLEIALGDIQISAKETKLKEVTISAEKDLIENKIDKMVYNVDKDVTSQAGVVSDVLKKVPQVSVDVDGNVELQGNPNIRFLINGKPSVIFGNSIAEVLQSIPASQIKSIEVITSPGAKYDAEGTGGIINIILKKNKMQGMNGNVSLSAGSRLENGSINLNMRKGNFGANAFFSGNGQLRSTTINSQNRFSSDNTSSSRLLQNGTSDFSRKGYQSGLGFDWEMTSKDNFSGSLGYNYFGNNNLGGANRETILQSSTGNVTSDVMDAITSSNLFHLQNIDWELSYKRKFKKEDQELEISYNSSNGNNYSHYDQTQKHISPETIYNSSYGNNTGLENESNFLINYTHPLSEKFLIETGAKTELNHINSDYNVYLLNTFSGAYDFNNSQSSILDYKRNVYAGYVSTTFKTFNILDVKTGVRYEYTQAKANFSNSGIVNMNPYNTIVPSIVIAHTFKNEQTLKLSYTRRIERPDYRDINPFVNASDPKNITTGNPNLRPEIGDKIELGYNRRFAKKGSINTTLFYRGNSDDIQPYTRYYSTFKVGDSTFTNVAISTRENIGHENNFGLNLFGSIPITEKINIRGNISGFERYIFTGISSKGDIHGFNYRINTNVTYQVSNTLAIELFGNFNSPRINAQGTMPSFTTYNFAFRKQIFNKNGSIALTATNFLNEYVTQNTNLTGDNFTLNNSRQLPYRSFGINFTYKFGKLEFIKEKREEDINLTNPPSPGN